MKYGIKKISDIGEYGIISEIRKKVSSRSRYPIVVDIGDDAFAADIASGSTMVLTKDLLSENIHFSRKWSTADEIGQKSISVNISDLAAMGAVKPLYCLVGLGLPKNCDFGFVKGLYTGMLKICKKYGIKIAGGDTVEVKKDIAISITLVGEANKEFLVRRNCAKPGDIICVDAPIGDSGAGLMLLKRNKKSLNESEKYLVKKHILPVPHLAESANITRSLRPTSMLDSSDGLDISLRLIAQESGVGAYIDLEKIPFSKQMKSVFGKNGLQWFFENALTSGEDYCLVFTLRPENAASLERHFRSIIPIGKITREKGLKYFLNGSPYKVNTKGYEHFR